MARHTSERERRAADAERELVQWKKVRFMADKVGDEFEGYITGVTAFGLFIELIEHFVEGLVHISTMADDYYRFVERHTSCAARTPARNTGWATRWPCRSSRSTWSAVRSIWAWWTSWRRCGSRNGTAVRGGAVPNRAGRGRRPRAGGGALRLVKADKKKDKAEKSVKRKQRPGRRERALRKGR